MNDIRRQLTQVFESGIEGDNIAKIEAIIERAVQVERLREAKVIRELYVSKGYRVPTIITDRIEELQGEPATNS
jgi:hypothetical protein